MTEEKRLRMDIEEIQRYFEWREKINSTPLKNIDFYEDGKLVKYPEDWIPEWNFTGLNNLDFIQTGFYRHGFEGADNLIVLEGFSESKNPESKN